MVEKKYPRYGPLFLMGSGLVILCSEFLIWVGNYSAWELIFIPGLEASALIYVIPMIVALLAISGGVVLSVIFRLEKNSSQISPYLRYWTFISFLIGLNLTIFYLTRLFQLHGNYLWQNIAIYVLIAGLICWFLGIVIIATRGTEDIYPAEN